MNRMLTRYSLPILFLGVFTYTPAGAFPTIVDSNVSGYYEMYKNTIITENGALSGGNINISDALTIQNYGVITSPINVCMNCAINIENYGTFNAAATLENGATITQVINTTSGITELYNINASYNVLVTQDVNNPESVFSWNDIMVRTSGAGEYTLQSAKIHMNAIVPIVDATLNGRIFIYTDTMPESDTLVFENVSDNENVVVSVSYTGSNHLEVLETYKNGSDIRVRVVRSNDYSQILGNSDGVFLNSLRNESGQDKLLRRLDRASSISEINRIMSKSVKLHPIKLMLPIKTLYAHKMLENMHIDKGTGLGIMPISVFSPDMIWRGAETNLNMNISDDLHLKLSGRALSLKYSDDINSYKGMAYGIGVDGVYNWASNNFLRIYGGFDVSVFSAGLIFDGHHPTKHPYGFSGYMVGELGHIFVVDKDYYFSPFVSAGGNWEQITRFNEYEKHIGVGSDFGFNFITDGLRYDYALRGALRSDGGLGAELKMGLWSIMDAAGAEFNYGLFYEHDTSLSHHVSLNVKFNF